MENCVIESEADKFLVLFEKVFEEKHIEEENITDYLDAEGGTFQDILEKIANKISEKILIASSENKSIKLLQSVNFFFKSFVILAMPRARFATARAAMDAAMGNRNRGRRSNFKIKFLLPQGRDVEVKHRGRVVRQMRVHGKKQFSLLQ